MDNFFKRIIDLILASIAFILFLPALIFLAILVKLDSPGPIFYIHTRVGLNGKEFMCFKFRSMKTGSDPNTLADSASDQRITNLGKFLRASSLDELPQLLNVILGDMSIVGPRPALPVQVKHFSERETLKLSVKPGITGWTQVNGRNSIPYDKRVELDVWYAENHNIFLDIWIMLRTFKVLILGDGIYDKASTSPTS